MHLQISQTLKMVQQTVLKMLYPMMLTVPKRMTSLKRTGVIDFMTISKIRKERKGLVKHW